MKVLEEHVASIFRVKEGMRKSAQGWCQRTSHTMLSTMEGGEGRGRGPTNGPGAPCFSCDFIPRDVFIFPTMRTQFEGLHFETMDEIQNVTTAILNNLHENDFWKCFQRWK
jgi:hypothetical protein